MTSRNYIISSMIYIRRRYFNSIFEIEFTPVRDKMIAHNILRHEELTKINSRKKR